MDDTDDDYRQDVLAHLPLLDMNADGSITSKDEDKNEPRPLYHEGSPSPEPSMGPEGMEDSPESLSSREAPYEDTASPDNDDSGAQEESSHDGDDFGHMSSDEGAPLEAIQEQDEEEEQEDQQGSSPYQRTSAPVGAPRQPVTSLNRTLRSKGPAHSTPRIDNIDTAGLEAKTKSSLKRLGITMKGYDESEQKDQAHLMHCPSFVEY